MFDGMSGPAGLATTELYINLEGCGSALVRPGKGTAAAELP